MSGSEDDLRKEIAVLESDGEKMTAELAARDAEIAELKAELAKDGPLNTERWTLDELLEQLAKWKAIASGKTCVSFENLCFGASSLWHQTHRENFRKIDRKPEELSRWVLKHANCVMVDFPSQVLQILKQQAERIAELEALTAARAACEGGDDGK